MERDNSCVFKSDFFQNEKEKENLHFFSKKSPGKGSYLLSRHNPQLFNGNIE